MNFHILRKKIRFQELLDTFGISVNVIFLHIVHNVGQYLGIVCFQFVFYNVPGECEARKALQTQKK